MKVLLINPRATYVNEIAQKCYPPLNLLYLAAALRQDGHTALVLDANALRISDEELAKRVRLEAPDLVGVALYSEILKPVRELIKHAKTACPTACVIVGGPHASAAPDEVLMAFPLVDYILRNEAEDSLRHLCRALDQDAPLASVSGLSWREGNRHHHNPEIDKRPDVEALPLPARELVADAYKARRYYTVMVRAKPVDTLITSRGCPFRCGFCYNRNHRYRGRTAESVIEELMSIIGRGIRDIEIVDDNFTADRPRAMRILDYIIQERLNVSFRIKSRVNAIDEELVRKAKQAGVYQISFGMESGVQRMLDAMEKRTKVEDNARACELTRRYGIASHTSWVIGYPGETVESLEQTINFITRIRPATVNVGILRPYPQTRAYQEAKASGMLEGDWSPDAGALPWVRLPWTHTRRDLEVVLKQMLRRIYYRPHYAWEFGREILRNANWTLARYAFQELRKTVLPRR